MTDTVKIISLEFILFLVLSLMSPGLNAAAPGLTLEEKQWLAAHDGQVRLAHTPDWPPMDFLGKNGRPTGMAADYIHLIEKKLSFKFKIVRVSSWGEILSRAKSGSIDVISAAQETEARRKFMTWSTPFLNLKTTIIVKKDLKGELTLSNMQGMKIGVVRLYAVGEFIREVYPDLDLVDVTSPVEGIRKVSFGELDAMITEVPNALYIIDTEKIPNLRLAGETGFELNHGMGIRRDWPIFRRIIEKTLAAITEQERMEIYNRWVRLEIPSFYQTRTFWYWVIGSAAVALMVIGTILFLNVELKKQVFQRTEALRFNEIGLEALLALNERPYKSIRDIIEFSFQQMLELTQSNFGYLTLEELDGTTYVVDSRYKESNKNIHVQEYNTGFAPETKGFWGNAVRNGKPIISNDYPLSNPQLKGVPEAHKQIIRYMNVPILNHGKIVGVVGMGNKEIDYTTADLRQLNLLAQGMWRLIQRKNAEQAMQKSEQRFEDLVENSPNGIAIVQNNKVVHQNSTQVQLMGDLNFMDPAADHRFHQDDLEKVEAFFAQILNNDLKQSELAFRFYTHDTEGNLSTLTWVTCIATPIDYHDQNAFLLIFIDMTEAKKFQQLLTIQDKMASLGNVSAGIAHEIRNPLSGINIYLGTIEKYFKNPDKIEKVNSSIEAARSASRKIESVIKRVMNFAKPTEPKFALINVNEPVNEAINLIRFTMNKKGIDIVEELDDDMPDCYAEPHMIEEVALNLINNAADAILQTRDEGVIKVSSQSDRGKVTLQVEDDGPGIPRDLREKVFDPFFTTKDNSTGIGLSLCHRIITDHKGKFTLKRSYLGGACFLIELPVSNSPAGNLDEGGQTND
jgi:PAS domain S-box-containing protein